MENPEVTAPVVPSVVQTEFVHNGKTYAVQTDPASLKKSIMVDDEKLGEVKLEINLYAEGEKAGLIYFVPEYADFEQLSKVMEAEVIVDCVNTFLKAKISSKATAAWNAKAGPKAEAVVRDAFLAQLSARNNVIVTSEEALAYRPFERGESASGLLRQQKDISKKLAEALQTGKFAVAQELSGQMLALMTRIQAFYAAQAAEYASLGEVAAQRASAAD